jgi:hypothetical protein
VVDWATEKRMDEQAGVVVFDFGAGSAEIMASRVVEVSCGRCGAVW